MNLQELMGMVNNSAPEQNAGQGSIRQEPSAIDRALSKVRSAFYGEQDPRKKSVFDSKFIPMRNAPEKYEGAADAFGGPMIFRAITPAKFAKATAPAKDLTFEHKRIKELNRAHRSKEGGLYEGSGKDRGYYGIFPGKKANELGSVYMPEGDRGKGYSKGLLREATQGNLRRSDKDLDLFAFKDPPKEGMPNLGEIYENAGFDEIDTLPYDPLQNANLREWNRQGFKPVPVGHYRYMEKFKNDPASIKPVRPRDESVLLDLKNLGDVSTYPKVLQNPSAQTELYQPTGKLSSDLRNSLTPENAERLVKIGQQGIQQNMPGWYNTRPILDEFINYHGQDEGVKKFIRWADTQKVFSPIASPQNQLQRSSFAQFTEKQGKDPTTLANAGTLSTHGFPTGLGSIGHQMQLKKLGEVIRGEDLRHGDLKRGQKIIPYGEAMKGGINEFVADRHMKNLTTSIDPSLPANNRVTMKSNEFAPLKKFYEEQVMPGLDLPLSQVQESVWGGGKDITGVSGVKSLAEILQELLLKNAQSQGLTPNEAKRKYFNHDLILR